MLQTGKLTSDGKLILRGASNNYSNHYFHKDVVNYCYGSPNTTSLTTPEPSLLAKVPLGQLWKGCGVQSGADPEIFVVDENDIIIPAFNFLPGAKDPKVPTCGWGSKIYNDGFQAEFTVSPTTCHSSLVDFYQAALNKLHSLAQAHHPGAKLSCETVLEIPEELLLMAESSNVQLGCMPSFNAYNHHGEAVVDGRQLPIRFVGSHIHIGTSREDISEENAASVVQSLDGIAGIASIALFGHREDPLRRKFYGLAGEFRLPSHGLEYRTISGMMLRHPIYVHLLLDLARYAARLGAIGLYQHHSKVEQSAIVAAINTSNRSEARRILQENSHLFLPLLENAYKSNHADVWNLLQGHRRLRTHKFLSPNWRLGEGDPLPYQGAASNNGLPGAPQDPTAKPWFTHSEGPNCCLAKLELTKEVPA